MIPVGLAATHAALRAWADSADGVEHLDELADTDLAAVHRVLAQVAKEVDAAAATARDLLVGRIMATSTRSDVWPQHARNLLR